MRGTFYIGEAFLDMETGIRIISSMGRLRYKISVRQESRGPVVVLIHGLGMTEGVWTETYKGRLLGGILPFRYVLTDLHNDPSALNLGFHNSEPKRRIRGITLSKPLESLTDPPEPLWQYLQGQGYDLITWSQRRPSGPLEEGVKELDYILSLAKKRFPKRRFILIGHSRGGLIARVYLDKLYDYSCEIAGLITLSTPHHGSRLASFGKIMTPVLKALSMLLPDEIGEVKSESLKRAEHLIKRIKDISRGEAFTELSPGSGFLKSLRDRKIEDIYYATFGGTNSTFTRVYIMEYDKASYMKNENGFEWKVEAKVLFSIPDILSRFTPAGFVPEELKPGKGDGLVSARSAHLEWSDEKHNLPLNHAMMLIDPEMKRRLLKILNRFEK